MARPLRLEYSGALWHVTARGNERKEIVRSDEDRSMFVEMIGDTALTFRWRLHAYVLMTNHYHLVVETPEPNLSRGMRQLNGNFAQRFNRRHHRVGHLFQGRFKGILVEHESHFLELARYVVLNPVRAGMVRRASEWEWSSYRATAGLTEPPPWLEVAPTLAEFHHVDPSLAKDLYRRFVAAGGGYAPWETLNAQIYLGSDEFRRGLAARLGVCRRREEHPRQQRHPERATLDMVIRSTAEQSGMTLEQIRLTRDCDARAMIAWLGRHEALATLLEVGARLSLSDSGVSRLIRYAAVRIRENEAFRDSIEMVLRRCRECRMET
ncbi:MAG TPA: transposase [Thermoanaerobaculia bacterium]